MDDVTPSTMKLRLKFDIGFYEEKHSGIISSMAREFYALIITFVIRYQLVIALILITSRLASQITPALKMESLATQIIVRDF